MTLPIPNYYWNFNETSGNIATDSTAQERMTVNQPDRFQSGKVGNGLRFNPTEGATDASTFVGRMNAPWTVGVWVKRELDQTGSALLSDNTSLKLEQWGQGGKVGYTKFSFGHTIPGAYDAWADVVIPKDAWTHVAWVATASKLLVYVNGVPYEIKKNGVDPVTDAVLGLAHVGSNGSGSEIAGAMIDEMKVFRDQALDANQVQELYNSIKPQILVTESGNAQTNGASYNLGSATVGSNGLTKTFTVSNVGTEDLNLSSISIDNGSNYILNPASTSKILKKGDQVSFTVTFNPKSTSPGNGVVSISSNDPTNGTFRLNFTGNAISAAKPRIEVSEVGRGIVCNGSATDFGSAIRNGTVITKNFSVCNRGDANLQIDSVTLSGQPQFTIGGQTGNQILGPNQCTNIMVTFRNDRGSNTFAGDLVIRSNDANQSSISLRMNARAIGNPRMIIRQHPSGMTINNGQTVNNIVMPGVTAIHVTVQNDGDADLLLNNFRSSNPNIMVDGGSRDLVGSTNGLISYGGRGAQNSQTTFSVIPRGGVDGSQMNGCRISFSTNDPNFPEFSFTISGVPGSNQGGYGNQGGNQGGYGGQGGAWRVWYNPQGSGRGVQIPQGGNVSVYSDGYAYIEVMPPDGSWGSISAQGVQMQVMGGFSIASRSLPAVPTQAVIFSLQCQQRGQPFSAQILYNGQVVHQFQIIGQ